VVDGIFRWYNIIVIGGNKWLNLERILSVSSLFPFIKISPIKLVGVLMTLQYSLQTKAIFENL
jgi:hypothetical protein